MSSPVRDSHEQSVHDIDPDETAEWLESFDQAVAAGGRERGAFLLHQLVERAQLGELRGTGDLAAATSPFVNTIDVDEQPAVPGDVGLQERLEAAVRWNAAVMVTRANRKGLEVGGHISTYQSLATLSEVGLDHFFRGKDHPGGGDQVFFQGHASPGVYARALLEGRLTAEQLDGFRQEASKPAGKGLSSYPHPRSMPDLWEFPTVSMGLAALNSIYQARFNRYLHHRGIKDTSDQHVWAFLGDGELGEPESLGGLTVAAREGLDNLTFVVNCNLQQLDGPVRGNGKIVQEFESLFRGAGWNVIKVIWGSEWDPLLAADTTGELARKLTITPDGQFQTFSVEDGAYIREKLFDTPTLRAMVEHLSDEQLKAMSRGGHDRAKVYAAYAAALAHTGQPTVIFAHTIKGHGIDALAGRNATHQMKKLDPASVRQFRDALGIPLSDADLDTDDHLPPYYNPGPDSDIARYAVESRQRLGGFLPERRVNPVRLDMPDDKVFEVIRGGSGKQKVASTMALVRLLRDLMRTPELGKRFVPIAPDEFRTFGMDSMFPSAKIYDPAGQTYESVDRTQLLQYKTAKDGQLLHEGINELGCVCSATAAGTSYATHGEPMIPFYIFYSMFGFQRTGDFLWGMSDQLARGFLIGATAGRTTLTGEGLQHADGQSMLLASANPAVRAYDAAFAFELRHIVRDALHRMYGSTDEHPHGENIWYYLTVYNEPISQPAEPDDLDVEGVLKGVYRYAEAPAGLPDDAPRIALLASGVGMPWALQAQQMLADDWGVAASVWSVTSWNELRRDGVDTEIWNLNHPDESPREAYVTQALRGAADSYLAVSDWMRAVPDQISRWVPGDFTSLGTDGFGFADTRAGARRFFQVDAESIVVAALSALARRGETKVDHVTDAYHRYRIDDPTAVAHIQQEGAGA